MNSKAGKRDRVMIASKVGFKMGDGSQGLRRNHILRAAEDSLRRLQTDYIDLYQSHTDDEDTPLEEDTCGLPATHRAGQSTSHRRLELQGPHGSPPHWSLFRTARFRVTLRCSLSTTLYDREVYERDLAPVAEEHGLGVIPYFSLASGFLTGKYTSLADTKGKNRGTRVEKYFNDRGLKILATLKAGCRRSQCGARFRGACLAAGAATITAPIASATKLEQLDELLAAVELKLSEAQLQALTDASAY